MLEIACVNVKSTGVDWTSYNIIATDQTAHSQTDYKNSRMHAHRVLTTDQFHYYGPTQKINSRSYFRP